MSCRLTKTNALLGESCVLLFGIMFIYPAIPEPPVQLRGSICFPSNWIDDCSYCCHFPVSSLLRHCCRATRYVVVITLDFSKAFRNSTLLDKMASRLHEYTRRRLQLARQLLLQPQSLYKVLRFHLRSA